MSDWFFSVNLNYFRMVENGVMKPYVVILVIIDHQLSEQLLFCKYA